MIELETETVWQNFVDSLNLEKMSPGRWVANTPDGRRIVTGVLINGQSGVFYESDQKIIATLVPTINPKDITRSAIFNKKIWSEDQLT